MVKQIPTTANPSSNSNLNSNSEQDLQLAFQALQTSTIILYNKFQPVFKIIGLVIIAYIAYRIGKLTVSQPIAKKVRKIQSQIQKIQDQKTGLPIRIKKIQSKYFSSILAIFSLGLLAAGAWYTEIIPKNLPYLQFYLAGFIGIMVFIYLIKIYHVSRLRKRSQMISQKQKRIRETVKQINKQIGPKVQSNMRTLLCREKISGKQITPTHICTKKDCQQYRQLLKERYQVIRNLTQAALQFQWCSTCKAKKPFDQLISFQAKPMPAQNNEISEEQDAQMKINYLLQTLQQMDKWVQDASPCNCSRLYMDQILKNKKAANDALKQLNKRIQQIRKSKIDNTVASANTNTVLRTDSKMSSSSHVSYTSSVSSNANANSPNMVSTGRVTYVRKFE